MSKGNDAALRLVVVDDSVEDAEAIVSGLRNAGIAIRPQRPASADELSALLSGQAVDLVLVARSSRAIPFDEAMQLVVSSGKDIPVLALFDDIDAAGVAAAIGSGARDRVARQAAAIAAGGAQRMGRPRSAPRPAPARGPGPRNRTPLRCADRILARPHRLRA